MAILGDFGKSQEEKDYEKQIADNTALLTSKKLTDAQRRNLQDKINVARNKLENIKASYESEMQKQGATDSTGRLLSAKDVQDQYIDRKYLNMRAEQASQQEASALGEAQQQALALKGTGKRMSTGQQLGYAESVRAKANDQIANETRSETLRAKGEASGELGRKEQYASKLTDLEREQSRTTLDGSLDQLAEDGKISADLLLMAKTKLEEANDDMLIKLAGVGAESAVKMLLGGGIGDIVSGVGSLFTGGKSNNSVGDYNFHNQDYASSYAKGTSNTNIYDNRSRDGKLTK
jgi:hypothetical protein